MEAMEKLKSGLRFSEVASQYSEDKARQGVGVPQGRGGEGSGARQETVAFGGTWSAGGRLCVPDGHCCWERLQKACLHSFGYSTRSVPSGVGRLLRGSLNH